MSKPGLSRKKTGILPDASVVSLRRHIALVHITMNKAYGADRGKKSDISHLGMGILYTCYFYRMRMTDLAKHMNVSKSTVTEYADTLEKNGYIKRVKGETSRRDTYLELTDKAKERVMDTERKVYAYIETGLSRLDLAEQEQFLSLLARFVGNADDGQYHDLLENAMRSNFEGSDRFMIYYNTKVNTNAERK